MMDYIFWAVLVLVAITTIYVVSRYLSLWIQAYLTGTRIGIVALMMMSLRKIDPKRIVGCKVMLVQAGVDEIPIHLLESQLLAGGNIERVTQSLIVAHRAGIELNWDTASALDLAGRDVLAAIQRSVNPMVILCPDVEAGKGETLDGIAQDGIQLKVRVRVTVRTNISQLVGGATEATVIARVGQGIVSAIGACRSYKDALADPMVITRQVLQQGLDSQTAFEIVSIDIADIDIGENIGARLQMSQAAADIRIAVAQAEQRRAMAVARKQEMLALTRENEAAIVEAEAQIPAAIASAYCKGGLRSTNHVQRLKTITQSWGRGIGVFSKN